MNPARAMVSLKDDTRAYNDSTEYGMRSCVCFPLLYLVGNSTIVSLSSTALTTLKVGQTSPRSLEMGIYSL